jgi:hypothetical protein
LIVKSPQSTISLHKTHVEVNDGVLTQVYGVLNLKAIYLHVNLPISIDTCYAIAKFVKLYFIDGHGNIVAKYKRVKRL